MPRFGYGGRKQHCLWFGLAAWVTSNGGSAEPFTVNRSTGSLDLSYHAPPECPNRPAVLRRIATQVRHAPSSRLTAQATISRQATGYLLELEIDGGTRRVTSGSCDSLVNTLTVILALAVDPQASLPQPTSELPRSSEPPSPMADVARAPNGNATPPVASEPLRAIAVPPAMVEGAAKAHVRLFLVRFRRVPKAAAPKPPEVAKGVPASNAEGLDSSVKLHPAILLLTEHGMLPRLAHGPSLGLWVDRGPWSLAATAEWLLPQWAPMPYRDQTGGYISFLGAQVGLCRALLQPHRVHFCLGAEAGDMMGKGSGVSNGELGHGFWLAGFGELGLRSKIASGLGADLRLGVAIPAMRPAFGFEQFSWRFEPRGWSLRLASGFFFF